MTSVFGRSGDHSPNSSVMIISLVWQSSMPKAERDVLCRRSAHPPCHNIMTPSAALRQFGAVLLAIAIAAATAAAQKPAFTIDAALSAPFPSELTAAPAGSRVAW